MQIQKIESHEFDEVSQTISNPAQHPNGNGKTSTTPILTELQEDDDLTPEEEQQLAGFNPATPQLISEEYRLKQDQESAVERPLAERASIRLGSVVAVVGTVMGAGAVLWFGFLQPRPPARQVTQSPTPTPTTPPTFNETAELKSRLAFQDQQQQLQPESAARSQSPVPSRPMASRSTAPAPTPAAVSPPITASRPDPVIVRSPVTPPERIQPIERVDPFQRWAQLANVGQLRVSSGAMEPSRTASNDRPGAQSNPSPSATQQNPVIPVVSIGRTETESSSLIYCARAQTLGLVGVRGVLPDRGSTPAPRSSDDPVVAKVRQLLELMRTENMTASEAAQSVGIPLDVLESLAGLVREARGLSVQSGNNLSAISRAWKLD